MIYLWIFNSVSWQIGSIAGAKLDRWSSGSPVHERNRVLSRVSKCRIEGAWTACGHTAVMHARACPCVRGIETLWAMDVSGAVNAAPLWGREAQVWLEVKLSTRNPFDDQHGAGAGGTTQQVRLLRADLRTQLRRATRGSVRGRFSSFGWRRGRSGACGPALWAEREEEIGAGTHLLKLS